MSHQTYSSRCWFCETTLDINGECSFCKPEPMPKSHKRLKLCRGCLKPYFGIGEQKYCSRHCFIVIENRRRKGELHPNWVGGVNKRTDGYLRMRIPEHPRASYGYVLQQIPVAEEALGRPLAEGEVVHHINGDKADNRPENLYVFPNNRLHSKFHKALELNPNLTPEEFMANLKKDE